MQGFPVVAHSRCRSIGSQLRRIDIKCRRNSHIFIYIETEPFFFIKRSSRPKDITPVETIPSVRDTISILASQRGCTIPQREMIRIEIKRVKKRDIFFLTNRNGISFHKYKVYLCIMRALIRRYKYPIFLFSAAIAYRLIRIDI